MQGTLENKREKSRQRLEFSWPNFKKDLEYISSRYDDLPSVLPGVSQVQTSSQTKKDTKCPIVVFITLASNVANAFHYLLTDSYVSIICFKIFSSTICLLYKRLISAVMCKS